MVSLIPSMTGGCRCRIVGVRLDKAWFGCPLTCALHQWLRAVDRISPSPLPTSATVGVTPGAPTYLIEGRAVERPGAPIRLCQGDPQDMGDECAASIPLAGWDWAGLRPTTSGECRAARYRFLAEYDGATLTVRQVLSSEDTVALRPLTGAPVCDSPQQGSCGPKDGPAAIAALTQGSSQRVAWHSKDPVGGSDGVLNVAALRSDHCRDAAKTARCRAAYIAEIGPLGGVVQDRPRVIWRGHVLYAARRARSSQPARRRERPANSRRGDSPVTVLLA